MTAAKTQVRAMVDRFQRVLSDEIQHRRDRLEVNDWGHRSETRWVWCERQAMHTEVNRARAELGLAPVPITAVERVERLACGHVDYFRKFTWYCAELALGVEEPRP